MLLVQNHSKLKKIMLISYIIILTKSKLLEIYIGKNFKQKIFKKYVTLFLVNKLGFLP